MPAYDHELPSWRTLLSASLLATAFLFPSWYFVIFFALVPWLYQIWFSPRLLTKLRQTFWLALLAQGAVCYWMIAAAQGSFGLPIVFAAIGGLVFFAINQLQFYVVAIGIHFFQKRTRAWGPWFYSALLVAALYVVADFGAPRLLPETLGFALAPSVYLKQLADLGGVRTLTFLIVLVNTLIFLTIRDFDFQTRRIHGKTLLLLFSTPIVLLAMLGYGRWRVSTFSATAPHVLKALLVPGDTDPGLKFRALNGDAAASEKIVNRFLELSVQGLEKFPGAEIVIWPETAVPTVGVSEQLKTFTHDHHRDLIFGTFTRQSGQGAIFNSIIDLHSDGSMQVYRKNILMPVAEYVPIIGQYDFARNIFKYQSRPGSLVKLLEVKSQEATLLALPVICFEALSETHLRRGAAQGGDFILNVSEDAWYMSGSEARLHAQIAEFASVETRKPQLRVAASGFSGSVNLFGVPSWSESTLVEPYQLATVSLDSVGETLFTRFGNWLIWICGFILLIEGTAYRRRTR